MKPNEIETYSKSIIGKLIDQLGTNTSAKAAFLTFDKDSSRSKNISSLDSSKHRVDTLESIATLLKIKLADAEGNKIYNKTTLSTRIVYGLFALLPSVCQSCSEHYTVDIDAEPMFTCHRCFQGSHNCTKFEQLHTVIENHSLAPGFLWLCNECLNDITPIAPRRSKFKHNSNRNTNSVVQSVHDQSKPSEQPSSVNSVESSKPVAEDKQKYIEQSNRNLCKDTLAEEKQKSPERDNRDLCEQYKIGKCPHGVRGDKPFNGISSCFKSHPKRCLRFIKHGFKGKQGCNRGKNCKYFHPSYCKSSLRTRACYNYNCKYPHLKGTKREATESRKTETSRKVKDRNPDINTLPNSANTPTLTSSPNHFLILEKMILDIDRRFEEELIPLRKLTESLQNQLAIPHQQHSLNIQS